jgi:hypothetical protein
MKEGVFVDADMFGGSQGIAGAQQSEGAIATMFENRRANTAMLVLLDGIDQGLAKAL